MGVHITLPIALIDYAGFDIGDFEDVYDALVQQEHVLTGILNKPRCMTSDKSLTTGAVQIEELVDAIYREQNSLMAQLLDMGFTGEDLERATCLRLRHELEYGDGSLGPIKKLLE